jgi:hypothetical protein
MKEQNIKRTITLADNTYQQIKKYCSENGLKIGWLTEKILLDFISKNNKNEQ